MGKFESNQEGYNSYPVREFLISDRFGNHIFYFKFFPLVQQDGNSLTIIPHYNTSLCIDLEEYPDIYRLLLELLQTDLETWYFNRMAQKLFKKIQSVSGIERYYFPKQVLTDGLIDWDKYATYKKFANQTAPEYDLKKVIDRAITTQTLSSHYWYLCIVFDSLFADSKKEISKSDFQNLISKNEEVALEYVNLLNISSSRFFVLEDEEEGEVYRLYTMVTDEEPILFFIIREK